jgi:homoserine O-acetyltransferase
MRAPIVVAWSLLLLAQGCVRARAPEMNSVARRAMLLEPDAPYWEEQAPASYYVGVQSTAGFFVIEVTRAWAPRGADRFYHLVSSGYYDDSRFSRIVPGFIAQFGVAGDSLLNALWSDRTIPDDSVKHTNARGTIAFAMTGPNMRTTQVFISLVDNKRLDAQGFAPIGRVIEGMNVVDRLYGGYGEKSGGGVRAGKQKPLMDGGNAYADREYPKLDVLERAVIMTYAPVRPCYTSTIDTGCRAEPAANEEPPPG